MCIYILNILKVFMDQLSFGSIKKMYMSSLFKCVVYICRAEVEQVSSYRFIGITITENQ